jgi:hypothetical protein
VKVLALVFALIAFAGLANAQTTRNQTNAAGSAGVTGRMQSLGYKDVHDLRRGSNGEWTGKATRNGVPSTVTVQPNGTVIRR